MDKKTFATTTAIAIMTTGGVIVTDMAIETVPEESTKYIATLSMFERNQKLTKSEKELTSLVKGLQQRRADRDEPSVENWEVVESLIDQERTQHDSLYLQALDRFIETADATTKKHRTHTFTKLKDNL